ncbi:TetR/AcrR family transcriptional regulator [Cupriavidus sp. LEh25]|nr:TetR/AcrR family transcriptional regulator [Cupriavidus sp. LEh25]
MALVCEKGIAGLTLGEVGERAGYSRGLAAHHYGHKEGLLVALVEQIGKDVRDVRQQVANWAPGLESVLGIVGFYVGRHPSLDTALRALHVLLSESVVTRGAVADALDRLNRESVSILEGHIRRGIEAGNIRADVDPLAESVAIIGAMRGVSAQYLFGMSDASAKAVRNALVETLRRGLRREPG